MATDKDRRTSDRWETAGAALAASLVGVVWFGLLLLIIGALAAGIRLVWGYALS